MNGSLRMGSLVVGLTLVACAATTDTGAPETTGAVTDDVVARATAACDGKSCGDSCKLCPPGARNCFETAEVKACNAQGRCSGEAPVCAPEPAVDAGSAWTPCGGKACGDTCSVCPPTDPSCVEAAVVKQCQPDGSCTPTAPVCEAAPYAPCGGKTCGQSCKLCPPGDPSCFETAEVKACDADGACRSDGTFTCP